jgi:pimeloyl-ACP methyl ester carboxylesterase/DNA-binding CsgD family transcriptional regulator
MVAGTVREGPAGVTSTGGQEIGFCRSTDGARLAYAVHGAGPPLIVVACWLSHLQYDWESPVWRHFLEDLGEFATVVRYDERGFGLSDWDVSDFSLGARLGDLESVVESLGLDRFALMGMSGGGPVAMAYALAHPDRVTRLILYGANMPRPIPEAKRPDLETWIGMLRMGWARPDPVFRRVFTTLFIPDASEEQMRWFDHLQRMSTSTENAIASRRARAAVDIVDELPKIHVPSIVLQAVGDQAVPFDAGVELAALIPGARFVPLDSRNHILLADEPAWAMFTDEVRRFMAPDRHTAPARQPRALDELSAREIDVLGLVAEGRTNDEIAEALTLSIRTVERHLSNIYSKLGITGRAARTAAVADYLRQVPR